MKNSSTPENLVDILEWGSTIHWENMAFAFAGCENINFISATDVPDLSMVTDMSYMFLNCRNMTCDIDNWNVGNINHMRGTFFRNREI